MRAVLLFAILFLALTLGTEASPLYTGIERAVIRRDVDRLEEVRGILKREIDLLGGRTWGPWDLRAYTFAYVSSRLSPILPAGGKPERLRLLREAEAALRQSLQANPRDAESHALLGSVYGAQISLSPFKALTLGPRVAGAFAEAERLAPQNPRVALQKGIGLFFVPPALGGGAEAAEKELRRAQTFFSQEPAGKAWPDWGRLDVLAWLGQVRARQGDRDGARALYERALALEPESVWVRRILLPQLDRPLK